MNATPARKTKDAEGNVVREVHAEKVNEGESGRGKFRTCRRLIYP